MEVSNSTFIYQSKILLSLLNTVPSYLFLLSLLLVYYLGCFSFFTYRPLMCFKSVPCSCTCCLVYQKSEFPICNSLITSLCDILVSGQVFNTSGCIDFFRKGSRADMHRILLDWFNDFISSLKQGTYRIQSFFKSHPKNKSNPSFSTYKDMIE